MVSSCRIGCTSAVPRYFDLSRICFCVKNYFRSLDLESCFPFHGHATTKVQQSENQLFSVHRAVPKSVYLIINFFLCNNIETSLKLLYLYESCRQNMSKRIDNIVANNYINIENILPYIWKLFYIIDNSHKKIFQLLLRVDFRLISVYFILIGRYFLY